MKNWKIRNGSLYIAGLCRDFTNLAYPIAEELSDSFVKVSYGSKYGCVNNEGATIIGCNYDVIFHLKLSDKDYLFCGKDGEIFYGKEGRNYSNTIRAFKFWILNGKKSYIFSNIFSKYNYIYTGKYDLYDSEGNLLIGGFDDLVFNEENRIFFILFGRLWEINYKGNTYSYDDCRIGKWCVLDEKFVIPFSDREHHTYTCGYSCYGYNFKGEVIKSHIIETLKMGNCYYPESIVHDFKWTTKKYFYNNYILIVDFPNEFMFNEIRYISNKEIFVTQEKNYYMINLENKLILGSVKKHKYPWETKNSYDSNDESDINIWDALEGEPDALGNID